jgi:NitT/TauT family transport system substrate-binding protein
MNKRLALLLILTLIVSMVAVACGPKEEPGVVRIKIAYPSVPDFGDLPSMMVYDRLVEKGYAVLPTHFAQSELAVEAVSRGDADIGTGATRTVMAAMQKGAPLKFIVDQVANEWSVYAIASIKECKDLDGMRLAIHSEGAVSTAMLKTWIEDACPGISPNYLIIPGSENRAAALLAGEIDATPAELADAVRIDKERPGEFNLIANFGADLPNLRVTSFYANTTFLEEHPQAAKDFIEALLEAHREIAANPDILMEEAPKYLPGIDEEILPDIVKAHVELGAWDVNGGLTEENMAYSLDFFVKAGRVEPGLAADDIADLSFLNDVLE